MATVRELKKDINFLTSEILSQCFVKVSLLENLKEEDVQPIMVETLKMRHELISKVNHRSGRHSKQLIKNYFADVRRNLLEQTTELLNKIEAVN